MTKKLQKYKYLIFDVDDTLLDFGKAFFKAQKNVAALLEVDYSDEFQKTDEKAGWKAWREMGLDDTECEEVQRQYHQLYNGYVKLHYKYLLDEINKEANPETVVACYEDSIASSSEFKESCTESVLRALSDKYKLVLATNGMVKIQEERIKKLKPYIEKHFISENMGVIKPTEEYYNHVLDELRCEPGECLMIGDSIQNDIIGAKKVGMDVCYYNYKKKEVAADVKCDFIINSINELKKLLLHD